MKTSYVYLWQFSVTFAIYFACRQIAENLFSYDIHVYKGLNSLYFYLLYFFVMLLKSFILFWIIRIINQRKLKLIGTVIFVMYGLQTFMLLTEMWFFRNTYGFTSYDLRTFFLQNLVTLALAVPAAVWINGLFYKKVTPSRKIIFSLKWFYLSLTYIIIYFVARYVVIKLTVPLQELYWHEEGFLGFFEFIKMFLAEHEGIIFFQALRGLLWIVFVTPVIFWYTGKAKYKLMLLLLLMAILPALQVFFPNILTDFTVKKAHMIGISSSNIIYALVIFFSFKNSIKRA